MATHSSILAWEITWTEEPGGLQSIGSQRVGHDWSDLACIYICVCRHTHILFCIFHYGLSQDIEYSSLCYIVEPVLSRDSYFWCVFFLLWNRNIVYILKLLLQIFLYQPEDLYKVHTEVLETTWLMAKGRMLTLKLWKLCKWKIYSRKRNNRSSSKTKKFFAFFAIHR